MLDKNAYTEPSSEEVRGNEFVNFTIETPSSSDTDDLKAKRLGKRFLLVIVGVLALLAVIIPIVIILTLPKHGRYRLKYMQFLSHDVSSGSETTPCNKVVKP